jgi:hypothetical protein
LLYLEDPEENFALSYLTDFAGNPAIPATSFSSK